MNVTTKIILPPPPAFVPVEVTIRVDSLAEFDSIICLSRCMGGNPDDPTLKSSYMSKPDEGRHGAATAGRIRKFTDAVGRALLDSRHKSVR